MGADRKANTQGGGARERGHGTPLERLAQLGDALHGVGAFALPIDAAELVIGQTAKGEGVSTGTDTKGKHSGAGSSAEQPTPAIATWCCP